VTAPRLGGADRSAAQDALAPVRETLLAAAAAAAADTLRGADQDVAARLAAAEARAAELVARSRAQGAEDGEAALTLERARGRRAARAVVLRTQREVYDELRSRCREAVHDLCAGPSYPVLRDRLVDLVHRELGPDATVRDDPDGGLVGELRGRRVDLSADALAERAVTSLGAQVGQLWAP
jgi:hypothetical protein